MRQIERCPAMCSEPGHPGQCDMKKWHEGLHNTDGHFFNSVQFPALMVTQCQTCTPTKHGTHHQECPRFQAGQGGIQMPGDDSPKAPKPSPEAKAAADAMLMVPNFMRGLNQEMQKVNTLLNSIAEDLESFVLRMGIKKPASFPVTVAVPAPPAQPEAKNFFLNEAHETHTTKHQARKDRKAYKDKAAARSAAARAAAATRKRRAAADRRAR